MNVVKNMRKTIQSNGGEVRFESKVTELCITDGKICGVVINKEQFLPAKSVILAIGHSARDTFEMLWEKQICMEAKSFAVGVRVEHPQKLINYAQYQILYVSRRLCGQCFIGRRATCSKRNELP